MKQSFSKRTFVTGGAGFIGSNYLNFAVPTYPDELFINVDSLTYAADLRNVRVDSAPNYVFEKADIRDARLIAGLFERYAPTGVIHFAAESHVDESIRTPSVFVETNVVGTNTLAHLAREHGVERFHLISTDEVYGDVGLAGASSTEKDPYNPRNPYSASKAGAELLVLSYAHTYGMPVVISRSSNNYGPRQDTTKLIPKFITNLLQGKSVPLYARGQQVRTWLYVADNVRATDLVFRKGTVGEIYNIGGAEEFTNEAVTKQLLALLGKTEAAIAYVADRPGHDFRYALSSEKIQRELGWKPVTSFSTGIQETVKFYKNKLNS
jgi:dTDP-glucose 4,6-dehydratase